MTLRYALAFALIVVTAAMEHLLPKFATDIAFVGGMVCGAAAWGSRGEGGR